MEVFILGSQPRMIEICSFIMRLRQEANHEEDCQKEKKSHSNLRTCGLVTVKLATIDATSQRTHRAPMKGGRSAIEELMHGCCGLFVALHSFGGNATHAGTRYPDGIPTSKRAAIR